MLKVDLAGGGNRELELAFSFWRFLSCPFARVEGLDGLVDLSRCGTVDAIFGEGFISRDYIGISDADRVEMLSPGLL